MAGLVIEFDSSELEKGAIRVKRVVSDATGAVDKFAGSVDKAEDETKKLSNSVRSASDQVGAAANATKRYEQSVNQLHGGLSRSHAQQERMNRSLSSAQSEFDRTGQSASRASSQIITFAASFLSIQSAISLVRQLASAQMDLERVQARLRVVSGGDSALAASTYKELATEAKRLGLDLNTLAQGYSRLAVATRGTSLAGESARQIFLGFAEASAALGLSSEQTEGALRSVEQMISKGSVMAEELRGQLGERLPGAFRLAAQAMGVTERELNDMLNRGEVAASDLLPKLAAALREAYGPEAAANANRLTGATNNLSTAWTELKNAVNEAGLKDDMLESLRLITGAVQSLTAVIGKFDEKIEDTGYRLTDFAKGPGGAILALLRNFKTQWKEVFGDGAESEAGAPKKVAAPWLNAFGLERLKAQRPAGLTDEAMESALRNHVKSLEAAEKAADQYAKGLEKLAESEKKVADHEKEIADARARLATLPTLDELIGTPDIVPYGPVIEQMSDAEKRAKAWSDEMEAVTESLKGTRDAAVDAAFGTDAFFDSMNQKHVIEEFETELQKLEAEFKEFEKQVSENFLRGVQSSLSTFFYDVFSGGEDALKNFGKALKDLLFKTLAEYLAQWAITQAKMLALSLKRIAAEKAAQQAANAAGGGGGGGGGVSAGQIAGLFGKGGGSGSGGFALSGSAIAGIAAFAVVAAAVAYFKHQRSERDKERYGTTSGVSGFGGSFGAGYQGRLSETGTQIANAMAALTQTLIDSSRAYIDGAMSAQVNIRNDKKSFQAMVDGELVGTFKTANEAIVAAIKTMFLRKADLDPAIRQVLENSTATDPEALARSVQLVQGVLDEIRGITEVEATLQTLPGRIRAMVGDLQMAGLEFGNAITMAHQWGLAQFRGAWDAISGQQRTPAEEKAIRERQKALLLDQMKLERIKLEQDIFILKAKASLAKGGAGLARAEIAHGVAHLRGQRALVNGEANLLQAQSGVWVNYLNERANFVEVEAGLYGAEIALLEKTLADLDALIAEVERTPIRLNRAGGGDFGNVIGGAGRFGGGGRLISALERLISAVDKLREFQKSLAQDEQLSPYSVQQRFGMAQAQFQNVAQAAQQGKVWAIEMLPDVARQYLELASQMYGTAGAGYGGIFEQVNQILQAISDQYPSGTDPQQWLRSGMDSVNRYLAAIRGDAGRRQQQHDETNQRLRNQERIQERIVDAVEAQGRSLERMVSTGGGRPNMGGPRTGNGGHVAG